MSIANKIAELHDGAFAEFEKLHAANNDAQQQDPNLREAVGQISAAVTALGKAARAASNANV